MLLFQLLSGEKFAMYVCVIWKLPGFQFEVEADLELAEVLRFSTCFMLSVLKPYEATLGRYANVFNDCIMRNCKRKLD